MTWQHLYTSQCPPSDAINANITPVYRLVNGLNISKKDFEPHRVKFPHKMQYQNLCIALGTSVYSDYSKILECQKVFPGFAKKKIAQGRIEQSDGKVSYGKDSHITWWIERNDPHVNFVVLP